LFVSPCGFDTLTTTFWPYGNAYVSEGNKTVLVKYQRERFLNFVVVVHKNLEFKRQRLINVVPKENDGNENGFLIFLVATHLNVLVELLPLYILLRIKLNY
jgi:hypothetical protein